MFRLCLLRLSLSLQKTIFSRINYLLRYYMLIFLLYIKMQLYKYLIIDLATRGIWERSWGKRWRQLLWRRRWSVWIWRRNCRWGWFRGWYWGRRRWFEGEREAQTSSETASHWGRLCSLWRCCQWVCRTFLLYILLSLLEKIFKESLLNIFVPMGFTFSNLTLNFHG